MMLVRNLLVLTAALLASGAMAQRNNQSLWELNKTYRGDGEETLNNKKNRDYSSVTVNLRNDGTATVRFGGSKSSDFSGKWHGPQNNVVTIDVKEADSKGYFRVFLEDREIRRVEGTVNRKDDYIRIIFKCEIVRGPQKPDWNDGREPGNRDDFEKIFDVRGNKATLDSGGDGSLRRGRNNWDIERMKLEIEKDGDLSIKIKGDKDETFRGKWKKDSLGRFSFTITEAFGDKKASGSGWFVFTKKNEVDQVRVNFRAKSDDYSLGFTRK